MNLTWFPPAPIEGPRGIVDLPPDDWAMEAKINGCRVLVSSAGVWTRQGTPLTKPKGAETIRQLTAAWPWDKTAMIEGEWEASTARLWLFDLPHDPGTYDNRVGLLQSLIAAYRHPDIRPMPRTLGDFPKFYEQCRDNHYEGVVVKRRSSLYRKMSRPNCKFPDWIKRRFEWDRK